MLGMESNRAWLAAYQLRGTAEIQAGGLSKLLLPLFNAGTMSDLDQYRLFLQEVIEYGPGAVSRLPAKKYQLMVYLAEQGHIHHALHPLH